MLVEFGNAHAIEGYRDPAGEDPDQVLYRRLPGERVTSLVLPDEMGIQEAFATVVGAMTLHMDTSDPTNKPSWIECPSAGLLALLMEHYKVSAEFNTRPATWGQPGRQAATTKQKPTRRRAQSAANHGGESDQD